MMTVDADRFMWIVVTGFIVLVPFALLLALLWILLHRDLKTLGDRISGVRLVRRLNGRGFEVKQIPGTTPGAEEKDIDHG